MRRVISINTIIIMMIMLFIMMIMLLLLAGLYALQIILPVACSCGKHSARGSGGPRLRLLLLEIVLPRHHHAAVFCEIGPVGYAPAVLEPGIGKRVECH
jgi:hypothetical protein